ncbi:MAG: DUF1330 domain-containing protein [bacterium]|nr:DUF1330 domain-containing protein [bacterium]
MGTLHPSEKQINELLQDTSGLPVVMINLLKYNDTVAEARELYTEYMKNTAPFLNDVGGKLLWMGSVGSVFIGESGSWDMALLVEYPSAKAFLSMISNEEYQKIHSYREKALEDSALLVSSQIHSLL